MKKYLIFILLSQFSLLALSQKIKYDDGIISIDKIKKFEFLLTKKGGFSGYTNAKLINLNSDTLLVLKDTIIYYCQLPNETQGIEAFHEYLLTAPTIDRSCYIQYAIGFNPRKTIFRNLEKSGFFSTGVMTKEIFNQSVEEIKIKNTEDILKSIEDVNFIRKKNYDLNKSKLSELVQKNPSSVFSDSNTGEIKAKNKRIGIIKTNIVGGKALTFNIFNLKNEIIGYLVIVPDEKQATVNTVIDNIFFHFSAKLPEMFKQKPNDPTSYGNLFDEVGRYLVNYGYL